MTYETATGERVLRGAEAKLFASAAWQLSDDILTLSPSDVGIQLGILLFDQLTCGQQMVMVDRVLTYLLDDTVPAPPRTALLDATIAAVFVHFHGRLEDEVYMEQASLKAEDQDTIQRLDVVEALLEYDPERNWPDAECSVMETWESALDSLQDRLLADQDWQMEGLTLDLSPEASRDLKATLGITGDYFIDIPPDVTDDQAQQSRKQIIERAGSVWPGEPPF